MDIRFINGRVEVYAPNSNGWKSVYDLIELAGVFHIQFVNDDGRLWAWPLDDEELMLLEEDVPLNVFDYM